MSIWGRRVDDWVNSKKSGRAGSTTESRGAGQEDDPRPFWRTDVGGALVALALVGALLAVILLGMDSDDPATPSLSTAEGDGTASDLTQTWPKDYASTTCRDWNREMTDAQQYAAAADILTAARNEIDGGTGVPPDPLIVEFQSGVTTACVIPSATLTDVTFGLYQTEPRFHP